MTFRVVFIVTKLWAMLTVMSTKLLCLILSKDFIWNEPKINLNLICKLNKPAILWTNNYISVDNSITPTVILLRSLY